MAENLPPLATFIVDLILVQGDLISISHQRRRSALDSSYHSKKFSDLSFLASAVIASCKASIFFSRGAAKNKIRASDDDARTGRAGSSSGAEFHLRYGLLLDMQVQPAPILRPI